MLLGLEKSVANKPPCLLSFTRGKAIEYMSGGESWVSVNEKYNCSNIQLYHRLELRGNNETCSSECSSIGILLIMSMEHHKEEIIEKRKK